MSIVTNPPLWDALLDAELNACYWSKLSKKLLRNDRWRKFGVAITSSGTAIAAWGIWQTHPIVWKSLAGASCIVSIYESSIATTDRLKKCVMISTTWKELSMRYGLLWLRDQDLTSSDSLTEYSSMKSREAGLDETQFTENKKLLLEARSEILKARGI
jgi:hypothetical protein